MTLFILLTCSTSQNNRPLRYIRDGSGDSDSSGSTGTETKSEWTIDENNYLTQTVNDDTIQILQYNDKENLHWDKDNRVLQYTDSNKNTWNVGWNGTKASFAGIDNENWKIGMNSEGEPKILKIDSNTWYNQNNNEVWKLNKIDGNQYTLSAPDTNTGIRTLKDNNKDNKITEIWKSLKDNDIWINDKTNSWKLKENNDKTISKSSLNAVMVYDNDVWKAILTNGIVNKVNVDGTLLNVFDNTVYNIETDSAIYFVDEDSTKNYRVYKFVKDVQGYYEKSYLYVKNVDSSSGKYIFNGGKYDGTYGGTYTFVKNSDGNYKANDNSADDEYPYTKIETDSAIYFVDEDSTKNYRVYKFVKDVQGYYEKSYLYVKNVDSSSGKYIFNGGKYDGTYGGTYTFVKNSDGNYKANDDSSDTNYPYTKIETDSAIYFVDEDSTKNYRVYKFVKDVQGYYEKSFLYVKNVDSSSGKYIFNGGYGTYGGTYTFVKNSDGNYKANDDSSDTNYPYTKIETDSAIYFVDEDSSSDKRVYKFTKDVQGYYEYSFLYVKNVDSSSGKYIFNGGKYDGTYGGTYTFVKNSDGNYKANDDSNDDEYPYTKIETQYNLKDASGIRYDITEDTTTNTIIFKGDDGIYQFEKDGTNYKLINTDDDTGRTFKDISDTFTLTTDEITGQYVFTNTEKTDIGYIFDRYNDYIFTNNNNEYKFSSTTEFNIISGAPKITLNTGISKGGSIPYTITLTSEQAITYSGSSIELTYSKKDDGKYIFTNNNNEYKFSSDIKFNIISGAPKITLNTGISKGGSIPYTITLTSEQAITYSGNSIELTYSNTGINSKYEVTIIRPLTTIVANKNLLVNDAYYIEAFEYDKGKSRWTAFRENKEYNRIYFNKDESWSWVLFNESRLTINNNAVTNTDNEWSWLSNEATLSELYKNKLNLWSLNLYTSDKTDEYKINTYDNIAIIVEDNDDGNVMQALFNTNTDTQPSSSEVDTKTPSSSEVDTKTPSSSEQPSSEQPSSEVDTKTPSSSEVDTKIPSSSEVDTKIPSSEDSQHRDYKTTTPTQSPEPIISSSSEVIDTEPEESNGLSTGAIVGIVIGCSLGAALITFAIIHFVCKQCNWTTKFSRPSKTDIMP